jgi:hypothetical protein
MASLYRMKFKVGLNTQKIIKFLLLLSGADILGGQRIYPLIS